MSRAQQSEQQFAQAGLCTLLVVPQPREVLWVSARAVGTRLRVNISVSTEKAPETPDTSSQAELVRKECSVQATGCKKYSDLFPGEREKNRTKVMHRFTICCVRSPSSRKQVKGCTH